MSKDINPTIAFPPRICLGTWRPVTTMPFLTHTQGFSRQKIQLVAKQRDDMLIAKTKFT